MNIHIYVLLVCVLIKLNVFHHLYMTICDHGSTPCCPAVLITPLVIEHCEATMPIYR